MEEEEWALATPFRDIGPWVLSIFAMGTSVCHLTMTSASRQVSIDSNSS
jgi:hypothetical protein